MQIQSARVLPIRLPLCRPLETAHGAIRARDSLILEVTDREGRRGYGEAAPIAGFPGESLAEARAVLDHWIVELRPGQMASPEALAAPIARGAVVTALLDLEARTRELPLALLLLELLGLVDADSLVGSPVPVNALLSDMDAAALAEAGRRAVADGFRTVKVKIGVASLERDCERLRALRAAVGAGIRIRADANAAWTCEAALRACAALAPFELEWLEQPVAAEPLALLHAIAAASTVPIAADESAAAASGALGVIEAGQCRALILKPALLGGPLEAAHLAKRACERGMQVAVTTLIDSAIGRAMALHVAALLPALAARTRTSAGAPSVRADTAHGLATGALLQDDVCRPGYERCCAGELAWSSAPGLGVAPEPEALERLRWQGD